MAGLIPQAFIDDLLDRADIVEVVDRRVKLKKAGKNYTACCPFHQEKTPSFTVNGERQFYYCFGCGAGGNVLGFLMDYENLEFPAAVEALADSVGMQVPREEGPGGVAQRRGRQNLYALMEEAAAFYQDQLRHHPQREAATQYLKERGLTGVVAKQFGIGFAPAGWDNLLKALGTSDERKKQLLQTGMLIQNDKGRLYDRFRERVVFPIIDTRKRVIGFGGRVLGDDKPKYLNSPETPIFQKGRELYGLYHARQANRQLQRILIVEGYMDVVALAQHGITNAAATLGTATSGTHLEKIYRLCAEVVFCFDGDAAGRQAARRALEAALPCMSDGRQARFLFLPEGEDPDSLVRGSGAEHFQTLVNGATPLEDFLFDSLSQGLDLDTMDGRARLSKLAAPMLHKLPQGVFRQLMFTALADRTGLGAETLAGLIEPPPSERPPGDYPSSDYPPGADAAHRPRPRQRPLLAAGERGIGNSIHNHAQAALTLLLHRPQIAGKVAGKVDGDTLRKLDEPDVPLLVELLDHLRQHPESGTHTLLGRWLNTEAGALLNRLAGQERLLKGEGEIEKQFTDTIKALLRRPGRQRLDAQIEGLKGRDFADISAEERRELMENLKKARGEMT